ncbi:restriction endonuclease subunit S, partial [Escherichia coli]|nr:restriction endonuclease subunit S [Escherichia coli]
MGSNEWISITLGELVDTYGGSVQTGPFGSQLHAADYVSVGIPSVMPKNIRIEEIDVTDIARISTTDAERLKKYRLVEGDIIYSRRGDVEKCALVTKNEAGWMCGTGCLRIRIQKNSAITPEFLHACLSTPVTREWISRHAIGATMPNLNTSILREIPLIIPPFEPMNFIGKLWMDLNKKLLLNRKINQTLEQMSQTLFKSWFMDFDPVIDNALDAGNPIPEALQPRAELRQKVRNSADFKPLPTEIRSLFPSEFEETELGWVPKGWKIDNIGGLSDKIFSGGTPNTSTEEYWNGALNWFSSGETRNALIIETEKKITATGVKNSSTRLSVAGDILIASAGQGHTRGQTSLNTID